MRIRENGSLSLNDPLTITEKKKKEIFAENISKETWLKVIFIILVPLFLLSAVTVTGSQLQFYRDWNND